MKCLQPSLVLDSFQCNWKEICQSGPRCFEFPSICTPGNPSSHDRGGIANCDLTKERFYADPQFALVPLRGILLAQQTYVFRNCSKFRFVSCDFFWIVVCLSGEGICVTDAKCFGGNLGDEFWAGHQLEEPQKVGRTNPKKQDRKIPQSTDRKRQKKIKKVCRIKHQKVDRKEHKKVYRQKQARKPRATLVWNYDSLTHWLTDLLTRVECRATSVAKKQLNCIG